MESSTPSMPTDSTTPGESLKWQQLRRTIRRLNGLGLLRDIIEPDYELLEALQARGVLSHGIVSTIREQIAGASGRNDELMRKIDWRKSTNVSEFLAALKVTDQEHVINFIKCNGKYHTLCGQCWPLDEQRLRLLTTHCSELVTSLDANDSPFLSDLRATGRITEQQKQLLVEIRTTAERNRKLLDIVRRRSIAHYDGFVMCIHDGGQTQLSTPLAVIEGASAANETQNSAGDDHFSSSEDSDSDVTTRSDIRNTSSTGEQFKIDTSRGTTYNISRGTYLNAIDVIDSDVTCGTDPNSEKRSRLDMKHVEDANIDINADTSVTLSNVSNCDIKIGGVRFSPTKTEAQEKAAVSQSNIEALGTDGTASKANVETLGKDVTDCTGANEEKLSGVFWPMFLYVWCFQDVLVTSVCLAYTIPDSEMFDLILSAFALEIVCMAVFLVSLHSSAFCRNSMQNLVRLAKSTEETGLHRVVSTVNQLSMNHVPAASGFIARIPQKVVVLLHKLKALLPFIDDVVSMNNSTQLFTGFAVVNVVAFGTAKAFDWSKYCVAFSQLIVDILICINTGVKNAKSTSSSLCGVNDNRLIQLWLRYRYAVSAGIVSLSIFNLVLSFQMHLIGAWLFSLFL